MRNAKCLRKKTTSLFRKAVFAEAVTVPTVCIGNGITVIPTTGATAIITAPIIIRRSVRAAAGTSRGENGYLDE